MSPSKKFATWMSRALVAWAMIFAVSGCINVSVPKKVEIGGETYYGKKDSKERKEKKREREKEHDRKKVDGDEAQKIAKRLARDDGINSRDYEIHDKKIDGNYWVLFEHKRQKRKRGRRNYFAVRVSRSGRGRYYGGEFVKNRRDDVEDDLGEEEVEKDDAYRIARRVARSYGAKLRDYEIHDKKIEGNYWVLFENEQPARGGGWKNHFAVRVSKFGRVMMYK